MITTLLLQTITMHTKSKIEALTQELEATLDFASFEQGLQDLMNDVSAFIVQIILTQWITSPEVLEKLKHLGARKGMKFKEYRTIMVRPG